MRLQDVGWEFRELINVNDLDKLNVSNVAINLVMVFIELNNTLLGFEEM